MKRQKRRSVLPVGTHVIEIEPELAAELDPQRLAVAASRVWLEQKRGDYHLHIGDMEPGSVADDG